MILVEELFWPCWWKTTRVRENKQTKKATHAFLFKWTQKNPFYSTDMHSKIVDFNDDCGKCFLVYIGVWANYAIENDYEVNKLEGYLGGINELVEFYKQNKGKL